MGLLADENFNRDIVRGLLLRMPTLDVVRVKDVGLIGVDDAGVLAWASENDRIILTHDRATMPDFAYGRLREGRAMPGMFVLNVAVHGILNDSDFNGKTFPVQERLFPITKVYRIQ